MAPEWLNGVAAIISALSWPAALITIVFVLRRELSHLIRRIQGVNFAGSNVQFSKEIKDNIAEAQESFDTSAEAMSASETSPKIDQTMRDMIQKDPFEAMVFSWERLKGSIVELAARRGISLDLRSMRRCTNQLVAGNVISKEMADTIVRLNSTYKSIVRTEYFELDDSTVEDYVTVTLETKQALDSIR
jgi:hypothetical protein